MRRACGRAAVASAPRLLEDRGGHLFERQREEIAVCPETLEGPREVRLGGDTLSTAGVDDAEEHACAVRAFGAAGEEHVETQLRDVLEFALGGRVVNGDHGVVDEAEERVAVVLLVANRRLQRLGREERRLDGIHPPCEAQNDKADPSLPMFAEFVSGEAERPRLLLFAVDRADEGATLDGRTGCVSSASRNFRRSWALQPASSTRPDA